MRLALIASALVGASSISSPANAQASDTAHDVADSLYQTVYLREIRRCTYDASNNYTCPWGNVGDPGYGTEDWAYNRARATGIAVLSYLEQDLIDTGRKYADYIGAAADALGLSWSSGGDFGGGGATGEWVQDCGEFTVAKDDAGSWLIPSIPLPPSGGYNPTGGAWAYSGVSSSVWNGGGFVYTDQSLAPLLRVAHLYNMQRGPDPRAWYGCWRMTSATRCDARSQAYFDDNGSYHSVVSMTYQASFGSTQRTDTPCPPSGSSGDAHYYKHGTTCVAYMPSEIGGAGGYAYPKTVALPQNYSLGSYLQLYAPEPFRGCTLNPELIAAVADKAYKAACASGAIDQCSGVDIGEGDVRTGDKQPDLGDLTETPDPAYQPDPNATPVDPTPDPEPDPEPDAPEGESWADPGIDAPSLDIPDIEFPTWFEPPDFSFGSPSCPIYTAEAFGEQLSLDIHCTLIDDNRAVLATLMIVVFSIASGMIVLRA